MADPVGTTRSAWAASIDGGETLYLGDTRDEAIGQAVAEAEDRIDCGDRDYTPTIEVQVYRDVLWCVGEIPGREGCHCEGDHSDYRWLALDTTRDGVEHVAMDPELAEAP